MHNIPVRRYLGCPSTCNSSWFMKKWWVGRCNSSAELQGKTFSSQPFKWVMFCIFGLLVYNEVFLDKKRFGMQASTSLILSVEKLLQTGWNKQKINFYQKFQSHRYKYIFWWKITHQKLGLRVNTANGSCVMTRKVSCAMAVAFPSP